MKRNRLILALALCLALICLSTTALAATKAATTVPTLKLTAVKGTLRGGAEYDLTVTPSVPGFLTLRILDANGMEVALVCEHVEMHTKANTVPFRAADAEGQPLPAGSYTLSASMVNQYGLSSKEATSKITVGDPCPSLKNVTVSSPKPFNVTVSFYGAFSDKQAETSLSLYRVSPKASFFDDFPTVEMTIPAISSTTIDLSKSNDLPTAAGYYKVNGAIAEWYTGLYSEQIEVDLVVDVDGSAYLLESAPAETLLAVDQVVADYEAGTLSAASVAQTTTKTTQTASGSTATGATTATGTATTTTGTTTATTGTTTTAGTTTTTGTTAAGDAMTYQPGEGVMGDEGLLIGVGVADTAEQEDAGYWGLTAESTDAEIWAAITRTMTSVDVGESESAYIYNSTETDRKQLGTVSGLTQGLNVVKALDNGWSLVEAYRNEDGAFVRGYIRSNKLRTVVPNQAYGIVIDKVTQKLTVWKDGAPIGSCSVSTGLPTPKYLLRETPAGEFITATRRGTTEYYGKGYCLYTIRINGVYHIAEIPTTKKNGSDFSLLEGSLGEKATRGYICMAHDASTDGGINAEWIWNMTTENKKVKVLILDDKDRSMVPVGE